MEHYFKNVTRTIFVFIQDNNVVVLTLSIITIKTLCCAATGHMYSINSNMLLSASLPCASRKTTLQKYSE